MGQYVDLEEFGLDAVTPESGDFSPPRVGEYLFETVELKMGAANGKKMLTLKARVVANADRTETDEVGKLVWQNYFPGSTKEYPRQRVRAVLDALKLDSRGFNADDAIGTYFTAVVEHKPYTAANGEERISADIKKERPSSHTS